MLFDKAQKIVEDYQIKNDIGNLDLTINALIEEFNSIKKEKKE